MRTHKLVAALAAVSLSAAAAAQVSGAPEFTVDAFRSHVTFLADDLLEGRNTGERGHEIAARYVATQLAGLGVKPAVNGDWYQRVPFVEFELSDAPARVTIGGKTFAHKSDVLIGASPFTDRTSVEAPVVFVGYGLDVPSLGLNDYAGLDVKGKIVAVLPGTPKGLPSDIAAHLGGSSFPEKRRMAQARGAVGILSLLSPTAAERFPAMAAASSRPGTTWVEANGRPFSPAPGLAFSATLNKPASDVLFAGAPKTLEALFAEVEAGGKPKGFALAPKVRIEAQNRTRTLSSPNVIGMIPGSDPRVANEYVLLMG
ncbi:MAG TPA: peptidase M28, partial [Allosphingosinicella sp.]|nr:peptidase M28 [Allosphingosinicella sp.]